MKTRSYDIAVVLSILTGKVVHEKGEKKILSALTFMLGTKVEPTDIAKAMKFCAPALKARYWRYGYHVQVRAMVIHGAIESIRKHMPDSPERAKLIENVLLDWKNATIKSHGGRGLAVQNLYSTDQNKWRELTTRA